MKIDLTPYFEWLVDCINWKTYTVEQIRNGELEHPLSMLSDWLDIVSLNPAECVGREVYYSVNSEHQNEITYDTWLEGCSICKGVVQKVDTNTITIENKTYWIASDPQGILFDRPEYCMANMTFDGSDMCSIDLTNGEITIGKEYSNDLIRLAI